MIMGRLVKFLFLLSESSKYLGSTEVTGMIPSIGYMNGWWHWGSFHWVQQRKDLRERQTRPQQPQATQRPGQWAQGTTNAESLYLILAKPV